MDERRKALIEKCKFSDFYENKEAKEKEIYFDAPLELLEKDITLQKGTVMADLCLIISADNNIISLISPVKEDGEDMLYSYDWHDFPLSREEINGLLAAASDKNL